MTVPLEARQAAAEALEYKVRHYISGAGAIGWGATALEIVDVVAPIIAAAVRNDAVYELQQRFKDSPNVDWGDVIEVSKAILGPASGAGAGSPRPSGAAGSVTVLGVPIRPETAALLASIEEYRNAPSATPSSAAVRDAPLFHATAEALNQPRRCPDCDGVGFLWAYGSATACGSCIGLGVLGRPASVPFVGQGGSCNG